MESYSYIRRGTRLQERAKLEVTIPSGSNTHSEVIDTYSIDNPRGGFIKIPAAWTNADIIFQFAPNEDKTDLATLYNDAGEEVRITGIKTGAKGLYHLPADVWTVIQRMRYIKILSVTVGAATAVNQAADRTIYLYMGN